MASHQGLHCLLKRKSFYVKLMKKNQPDSPKMKNGLFQIIRMEESIQLKRVNFSVTATNCITQYLDLIRAGQKKNLGRSQQNAINQIFN